jgi:hypothetical protein
VGTISASAGGSSAVIIHTLLWLGLVPLTTALLAKFLIVETKLRALDSH